MKHLSQLAVGDRVKMAKRFLDSIHVSSLDRIRKQRGFIVNTTGHILSDDRFVCVVQWDDGHVSKSLNVNLTHVKRG